MLIFYLRLFYLYSKSWFIESKPERVNRTDYISVVIACRNEEENISELIRCINSQSINKSRMELIVVNDNSDDNTLNKLMLEKKNCSFLRIIDLKSDMGKIKSIREAIKIAKGQIILCTDADCRMSGEWMEKIIDYFTIKECNFVSSPVVFSRSSSLFTKYQELELLSLVISSGSAIQRNHAILCNGANIAFRKKIYLEIPDNDFDDFYTDDISLLHYFKKYFKGSIFFAKDDKTIITTSICKDLSSYFSQKMRWVYSSRGIKDSDTILVSLLIYSISLLVFICTIFLIYSLCSVKFDSLFFLCSSILFIKVIIDYSFLSISLGFFKRRDLLIYLFPFIFINSIITVVIVPLSFLLPIKWKGRKI